MGGQKKWNRIVSVNQQPGKKGFFAFLKKYLFYTTLQIYYCKQKQKSKEKRWDVWPDIDVGHGCRILTSGIKV